MDDWLEEEEEEEDSSAFLESFPTYRLHSRPDDIKGGLWVFSSKDERYENNSYSSDDAGNRMMIYDKIISAFSKMDSDFYGFIAQFWTPVTIDVKHLLSISGQPFAVNYLTSSLKKYRRLCVELVYDIDVNSSNSSKFRGAPASAFLNRFPEMATIDEVDPLLRNAFQEGRFDSSVMIPICFPSQTSSSSDCIGVIECSSWIMDGIPSFVNMKIKEEGLSVCTVQYRIPYKVWIASLDENHVHFSSSLEDAQTRRLLGLKLTGYISVGEGLKFHYWFFEEYYDACDMIFLQPGSELVLKTLQDSQPRFCKNISQLGAYKFMGCRSPFDGTRSLTICMRSILTGDFSYVFEFLWNHCSSHPISLEIILFDIQRCLQSFKFASGTETGDRLHVIDVDNSTNKEIKKLDIFQAKRLSPIPEALKERKKQVAVDYIVPLDTNRKAAPVNNPALSNKKRDTREIKLSREDITQHYGKTMEEAAEELGVSLSTLKRKHSKLGVSGWQGPNLPQRKAYNSNKNQSNESHTHEKDNVIIQDPSPVKRNDNTVIKAEYADDIIRLHISEITFVTVENEIGKEFNLKHETFKIKYLDEVEDWILMKSDQDIIDCMQNSRNVDRFEVRLRVFLHDQ